MYWPGLMCCMYWSGVLYVLDRYMYVVDVCTELVYCVLQVCTGLVCSMKGRGIAPASLLKREGDGGEYQTPVYHPQIFDFR